ACTLGYEGLDGVIRRTTIEFQPAATSLDTGAARFDLALAAQQSESIYMVACCRTAARPRPLAKAYEEAQAALSCAVEACQGQQALVTTGNQEFNRWLHRSSADLQMMISETEHGLYPYAGVPWFSTVFGRDGI